MNSYKFYMTHSVEVADLLARGLRDSLRPEDGECISISYGAVNNYDKIPANYHNIGLFFACIEYQSTDGRAKYAIVNC